MHDILYYLLIDDIERTYIQQIITNTILFTN